MHKRDYMIGSMIVNSNYYQADVFHAPMFQNKFLSQYLYIDIFNIY